MVWRESGKAVEATRVGEVAEWRWWKAQVNTPAQLPSSSRHARDAVGAHCVVAAPI